MPQTPEAVSAAVREAVAASVAQGFSPPEVLAAAEQGLALGLGVGAAGAVVGAAVFGGALMLEAGPAAASSASGGGGAATAVGGTLWDCLSFLGSAVGGYLAEGAAPAVDAGMVLPLLPWWAVAGLVGAAVGVGGLAVWRFFRAVRPPRPDAADGLGGSATTAKSDNPMPPEGPTPEGLLQRRPGQWAQPVLGNRPELSFRYLDGWLPATGWPPGGCTGPWGRRRRPNLR
jgi:hypothetical protein